MPLTRLAYSPDFGDNFSEPLGKLTNNWLDLFVQALITASGLEGSNDSLKKYFLIHIGSTSAFDFKLELILELQLLYKRFRVEGQYQLSTDVKAEIAIKILEGIIACSSGFYNRVLLINQSFSTPNTLQALLTKIRHNIVNNTAIAALAAIPEESGQHVHIYNRFYLIASLYYGVQPIQKKDPYTGPISDRIINNQLNEAFKKYYCSPLHLIIQLKQSIQNVLEEKWYYTGRKEEGCNIADTNKWVEYLEKLGIANDSCLFMNYPYTDEEGQALVLHTSFSPLSKNSQELKAFFNEQNGLIFFEKYSFLHEFFGS